MSQRASRPPHSLVDAQRGDRPGFHQPDLIIGQRGKLPLLLLQLLLLLPIQLRIHALLLRRRRLGALVS